MTKKAAQAIETGFDGVTLYPAYLAPAYQRTLVATLRQAVAVAPFYRPHMPRTGEPWSIRQTNLGPLGWLSGEQAYFYGERHPLTQAPWPAIPAALLDIWSDLARYGALPECCLVNFYQGAKARMGLHQDRDELALDAPVVSVSLGDTCTFRIGGFARGDKTKSFRLASGDVLVMGGASRLRFHGVDRISPGSSQLLDGGGRLNLTLRRVTTPSADPA
jgi:alkylated DNA repair protein (DNA oxidative demethylase)